MNTLEQIFEYHEKPVRTAIIGGAVWFVAQDVCEILDIANARDAIGRLPEDEKGTATTDTLGGRQEVNVINEPGVYRLVFSCRKKKAEHFKRWVFHEVLPSIRRTGSYSLPENAGIADAVRALLPPGRADELIRLSQNSDQTASGFPFHDDRFMTAKEIAKSFENALSEQNVLFELIDKGFLAEEYCPRGRFGATYSRYIYRLTDKGKQHGEEILNQRRRNHPQPFSFRWRAESVPEILASYMPMLKAIQERRVCH